MTPKTFIPEYTITQTVTAIRLVDNYRTLAGTRTGGTTIVMRPLSLRVFDTDGTRRVEATGPRVYDDATETATWSTVTVDAPPEWVLAVLDGVR